jgi:hypothetical protein
MRSALAFAAPLLAVVLTSGPSRADWPMARHDPQRTAFADGAKSDIQKPVVAWSAYLGGSLAVNGLLEADVEGNGKNAFIRASSGSVAALRTDGSVVWKTRTSGATFLVGIADLDGKGKQQVVANTYLGALALDLQTGAIVWQQPNGQMGIISIVRMADMNGDGLPDLTIGECRSCSGGKMQTGFIYSFGSGFSTPPNVLPFPSTVTAPNTTAVNMAGTGGDDLIIQAASGSAMALVDGSTGLTITTSADLQVGNGYVSGCLPAPHSTGSGADVICALGPSPDPTPGPTDASRVFALTLKPGTPPTLAQLWSVSLAPTEAISNSAHDLFVDLAGDGNAETLITGVDASGNFTVHILQASTGKELAKVPGLLIGTAPTLANGGRVIMTQGTGSVSLFSFAGSTATPIGTAIMGDGVAVSQDWTRSAVSSAGIYRPITVDFNGDGAPDFFTIIHSTGELLAFTPGPTSVQQVGSVTFSAGDPLTGAWPTPPMDETYPQLAVLEADGILRLLDKDLSFTSARIPVGGFYANGGFGGLGSSPVVASFNGGPAQVLVGDGQGALLCLDASKATPETPPTVVWQSPATTSPVIAKGLDGDVAGVFALHVVNPLASPEQYVVRRMKADGTVVWDTSIDMMAPTNGIPREDLVLAHLDADGVPDVALQAGGVNAKPLTTYAISGADGHTLWTTTLNGCGLQGGMSSFDWNGDGIDDLVQQGGPTYVVSGVDGSMLATGGPGDCFFLGIPYDLDGDGIDEIVFTAGQEPEQVYSHDLQTALYVSTESDQPFPYGAITDCPDGPRLIEGSLVYPSRLKITELGPGILGQTILFYLAGGALYTDQTSANAVGLSQLTAVNVHPDLTGNGKPTAVVGSDDGWLYAVDPCVADAGTLTFAYDFQAPVGEPVFGDTDGDGLDEIIVEVDDGYIYALRNGVSTGTGGEGTGGGGPWPSIYGRAGCCGVAGSAPLASPAALVFILGLLAAAARRNGASRSEARTPRELVRRGRTGARPRDGRSTPVRGHDAAPS